MLNTIYTLIALFTGLCKRKLAEADHAMSLELSEQLRASDQSVKDRRFAETEILVEERLSVLRKNLLLSFLFLSSASGFAWLTNEYKVGLSVSSSLLVGASAFCFAWATLGRLGWRSRSFKGLTSVEKIDDKIFFAIYWLGAYFGTVSIL